MYYNHYDYEDFSPPHHRFSSSQRRAAKNHPCDGYGNTCLGLIKKGTVYVRNAGVFDGQVYAFKNCQNCAWEGAER